MAVTVHRSVPAWLRSNPDGGTLQVRAGDPEAAARAINSARADIEREIDPNCVTNALPSADGAFFWIDGKVADDYGALPEILTEHLIRHGVHDAVIAVPPKGGPLTDPKAGLAWVRRAVVLSLYPPPPFRFYEDPPAQIPNSWLAEAVAWVKGDLGDDAPAMAAVDAGMEFPLPLSAAMPYYVRARRARPVTSLLVTGDLGGHLRGANGCFHSPVPRLVLAGGGPGADDDALLTVFSSLIDVARRLAPGVALAFVGVQPTFGAFSGGKPGTTWDLFESGEDPVNLEAVCDEFVFDAYPYQVLGPRHLARLGAMPAGGRPLEAGRVEVAIGGPADWLLESYDPSSWRELSSRRRDPRIQAKARKLLAPCMLSKGEATPIRRARVARATRQVKDSASQPEGRT